MKVLLDTHCWLWWLRDPSRLSPRAAEVLASKRYERYLSVASAWEIAIKWRRGRLRLPEEPRRFVPATLQLSGVAPLAVELSHALCVASLPLHHSDPFDRLLVAQTQMEGLSLLSADPVFDAYGVDNLWT